MYLAGGAVAEGRRGNAQQRHCEASLGRRAGAVAAFSGRAAAERAPVPMEGFT